MRYTLTVKPTDGVDVSAQLKTFYDAESLGKLDHAMRRMPSIDKFVIRLDYHDDPKRKEAVFRIAALRKSPTDRADCSILRFLRRTFPPLDKLTRGEWVEDHDDDGLRAFADYKIIEQEDAIALMQRLQDKVPATSFISSTDLPILPSSEM